MKNNPIKTRIAPSPTGYPHVGTLYQALFNYAFARRYNGAFLLRIEDTDRARFVPDAEEKIIDALAWVGIEWQMMFWQSKRLTRYQAHAQRLVDEDKAYYDGQAIRMRVPRDGIVEIRDGLRGIIQFNASEITEQVILKSDGYPTYHLASVVDDHEMAITHVIRGEEWLSSAPKHMLLYQYFGWEPPLFYHTPLLRSTDNSKLSKRKGHTDVEWFKEEGYLPQALTNYLATLGWTHPHGRDIFSLEEFTTLFDIADLQTTSPQFDMKKLDWYNQQYMQRATDAELMQHIIEFYPKAIDLPIKSLVPLVRTRMKTLKEFETQVQHFFPDATYYVPTEQDQAIVKSFKAELLGVAPENWDTEHLLQVLKDLLKEFTIKMPVLYQIITGQKQGLPLPESLVIIGRETLLRRL